MYIKISITGESRNKTDNVIAQYRQQYYNGIINTVETK